ncbi:unnamed protein product [Nezara viridula]|uniref:Uncharacterized protein n=1 Tax=Nezara viridula TaxID=85310 RepID=A0A9P0MSW9_NEZVI|nr:unnamed protein product [Nezara viridula]
MENLPFRSVYHMDYLGGKYGRYLDSLLPGQFGQTDLTRNRSYNDGVRLLQERQYRWLREVMVPRYGKSLNLTPLTSDTMESLRYQQREYRRQLAQPKEVKPLLFSQAEYARMEDFNTLCDLHRNTYRDYDKFHIKYPFFKEEDKYFSPTKDYIFQMSVDMFH